jgi:hypothetical protein
MTSRVRHRGHYAFDDFESIAMSGDTDKHSSIEQTFVPLSAGSCVASLAASEEATPRPDGRQHPFADGFVVCSPTARNQTVISDPVVISEVLIDQGTGCKLATKERGIRRHAEREAPYRSGAGRHGWRDSRTHRLRCGGRPPHGDSIRRMPNVAIGSPLDELSERIDDAPPDTDATAAD